MFTDRKKFAFFYPGQKVNKGQWLQKGQQRECFRVNKPNVVNVYAGITYYGMTKAHIVSGTTKHKPKKQYKTKMGTLSKNITQSEYKDVLINTLLPEGNKLFKPPDAHIPYPWTFQQDNDPAHAKAGEVIGAYNKANSGHTIHGPLKWPPNSPDLSPIENIWARVQAKVESMCCKDFDAFQKAVLCTIKDVPLNHCRNLMKSMAKRLVKVEENQGNKTRY